MSSFILNYPLQMMEMRSRLITLTSTIIIILLNLCEQVYSHKASQVSDRRYRRSSGINSCSPYPGQKNEDRYDFAWIDSSRWII